MRNDSTPTQSATATKITHATPSIGRTPLLSPATNAADAITLTPLATLLAGNVVPQGEIVNLLMKPSRWFIWLNSMRFAAIVVIVISLLHTFGVQPFIFRAFCVQLGIFLIAGRIMWSVVEWMGRYYILTDMRLMRVCGIFDVRIDSCMLRKVESVRLYPSNAERMLSKSSLDIFGCDRKKPITWQTISRPASVHQQVQAAVNRAKYNGGAA